MIDINRYIVNGSVKRDRIVSDIKRGRISKNEIIELDQHKEIKAAYFGNTNFEKIDRDLWNESYLDELSLAAVSETFCGEYLLYLNEVAQYVIAKDKKRERNNKILKEILVGIFVVLIVLAIVLIVSAKKETVNYSVTKFELTKNMCFCFVKKLG